tara:strand:- start:3375 stop:3596 length:222 start_codon:yes stop_codon:yes gene_type:complete
MEQAQSTVSLLHIIKAQMLQKNDFGYDMTHDEKKARVERSVGYLKYQKTFSDWGSESFTDIDAAISAADAFTA